MGLRTVVAFVAVVFFLCAGALVSRIALTAGLVRQNQRVLTTMCISRFVSPALEERKKKGLLTGGDLERMYGLTVRQTDRILSAATSSRPFDVGCVLSLEGALVDLTTILGYSFAALAGEIGKNAPKPKVVQECVGLTFHESLVPLGWGDLSSEMERLSEARFEDIALKFMEGDFFSVPARTGSDMLLQVRPKFKLGSIISS